MNTLPLRRFAFQKSQTTKLTLLFFILFLLPFCVVGVWAMSQGIRLLSERSWAQAGLWLIFALAFGGFGFGMLLAVRIGLKKMREDERLKIQYPDQPWMWKKDWITGRIRCATHVGVVSSWVFCLFWNLISAPVFWVIPREILEKGNRLALLALVFPFVGLWLLIVAIRQTLRWRKFGDSVLELSTLPGVIGAKLGGTIHARLSLRPQDKLTLTLSCVQRITTGAGKNRDTHANILWQDEQPPLSQLPQEYSRRIAIPIAFEISGDCRGSDWSNLNNQILWQLEVHAKIPGVDYHAIFEVPVFRTSASLVSSPGAAVVKSEALHEDSLRIQWERGVSVRPHPRGGMEISLGAARHPAAAISTTLFLILWWTAIWLQLYLKAPLFFPIISGLIGLLIFWAALDLWLGTQRVWVSATGLQVTHGILGWGSARTFDVSVVGKIQTRIGMQMGRKAFYDVVLVTKNGRKIVLGSSLSSNRQAEALVAIVKGVLDRKQLA